MSDNILRPGYMRWDGTKFVLDSSVEIVGPPGPQGPAGLGINQLTGDVVAGPGTGSQVATVNRITGTGTNPYSGSGNAINIVASSISLASGNLFNLDRFTFGTGTPLAGTSSFHNLFVFSMSGLTGSQDWACTLLGVDNSSATGVYRADLTFTTIMSGGSLNTILQPTNPQNVRNNGTLIAAVAGIQVNHSSNNLQIQVNVNSGVSVNWSLIGQVQWRK